MKRIKEKIKNIFNYNKKENIDVINSNTSTTEVKNTNISETITTQILSERYTQRIHDEGFPNWNILYSEDRDFLPDLRYGITFIMKVYNNHLGFFEERNTIDLDIHLMPDKMRSFSMKYKIDIGMEVCYWQVARRINSMEKNKIKDLQERMKRTIDIQSLNYINEVNSLNV